MLKRHGISSAAVTLIVNTHFHCDHAGANYALQSVHGTIVAASGTEAALVNSRDPEACRAGFLSQPVEPYTVDRKLDAGDVIGTGDAAWDVIATPGHTLGHIALWCQEHRVLVSGDALHDSDVGWVNPYQEGPDALERTADTIERIAALDAAAILPGHGPQVTDVPRAIERARRRVRSWQDNQERMTWHACKRIFAYALMLADGMAEEEAHVYLCGAPWVESHATQGLGLTVDAFIPALLREMRRANAAQCSEGVWAATAPYDKPWYGWPRGPSRPENWPPARNTGATVTMTP